MAVIELINVSYQYPLTDVPVLKNIDLSVQEGEFIAVIGPNGAGKSTLCYAIAGFIPHFFKGELNGTVKALDVEVRDSSLSEWVLNVGLVFQNPFNQISGAKYTVFEEIAFGLENIGVPREQIRPRVQGIMEMTGITDLGERAPYSLSGGQQQRVALASILVMEPRVLVLDEPTSQLDPIGTREVFDVIHKMSDRGLTVILVEHKMEWIAEYADRVLALSEGEILVQGIPQEVLTAPELLESGFGLSRYTTTANRAAELGLWPAGRSLPTTLDEAVQGFEARREN